MGRPYTPCMGLLRVATMMFTTVLVGLSAMGELGATFACDDVSTQPASGSPESRKEPIAGTTLEIELVKVPGSADGSIKPLWVARTETLWDWQDICIYKRDQKDGASGNAAADACTRPTKPYTAADRGFGHGGFPAVSISFDSAKAFCEWLSAKTGRRYRLPTVAERRHLCARAGSRPTR